MNNEERREKVALALARRDGHEDIVDWWKTIYAGKADAFIEEHPDTDLCPECGGTGFTYHEVIEIPCPLCSKPVEVVPPDAVEPIEEDEEECESLSDIAAEANAFAYALMPRLEGENDDSDSGTGQPNPNTGSGDTGQPEQPKKPKAKRKARKKSG